MVRKFNCNVQSVALTSRLEVGNGGFKQMSSTVLFVHHGPIRPPLIRFHQCVVGIQVAIILLSGGKFGDQLVQIVFDLFIGLRGQNMCSPFHYFVNIRIVEVEAFEFSFGQSACNLEVFNSTSCFTLAESFWQCRGTVNLNSGDPELVGKLDLGNGYSLQYPVHLFISWKTSVSISSSLTGRFSAKERWAANPITTGALPSSPVTRGGVSSRIASIKACSSL